jgi:hypothetical protein
MASSVLPSKERVNKAGRRIAKWLDGEAVLSEDELQELVVPVLQWRAQHTYPMSLAMPSLRKWAERYSTSDVQPSQRLKRLPQIIDKLQRHPDMKLARMQDIGGARVVLSNRDEVEKIHRRIRMYWDIDRIKDWREEGRPDTGYRALHLMVPKRDDLSGELRIVEIQLRTKTEHRWSQVIMATGERLGYSLRDGDGPPDLLLYFKLAGEILAIQDRGEVPEGDLRERFIDARQQASHYFVSKGA